jgi:hypothetical protein
MPNRVSLIKDLSKFSLSGAISGAFGAILAVYLIDFINFSVVGHAIFRDIWTESGFSPWCVQMAQFGAPFGLVASTCSWIYRERTTKDFSMLTSGIVWFVIGFVYFYWIFRIFCIKGDYYYLALTSYGLIAGLLFKPVHRGIWSSIHWILHTPVKIGAN